MHHLWIIEKSIKEIVENSIMDKQRNGRGNMGYNRKIIK
ncbi:unnamed protein product [Paramecium sonneborni]|uniref:Uncharacterized protein n=1 Tax=Paramecium sonneborni TaxID=65129 RepID=A0A8S1RL44_9CILI|nr:unnamed protein product [Paramecium sonneborni]